MKAFRFRLEQALRWRAIQRDLEKSRVSRAAGQLHELLARLEACRAELRAGAAQLSAGGGNGSSLAAWAGFMEQSRRRIGNLVSSSVAAEQELAQRMQMLSEADRKVRLLENLRQRALSGWEAEFSRELDALAGELHLMRLQSKDRKGA